MQKGQGAYRCRQGWLGHLIAKRSMRAQVRAGVTGTFKCKKVKARAGVTGTFKCKKVQCAHLCAQR